MCYKKTLCIIALFIGLPILVHAQTGTISGTVREERHGDALPSVNVFLEGTTWGTITKGDGGFTFQAPPGQYILVARILGYGTGRQDVEVVAGKTVEVSFALPEQPIEIDEIVVERVMMTGGRRGVDGIPGSAHYISPRALQTFSYNDAHRILREVPGVYVQEEDGYGLRPNIGLRGTGLERSSKITVMEDGVLIAPAPYAAPAAYYFPTMGRMQAVEVRKGSSQIKYGPYTTGGAINLVSTQIPFEPAAHGELTVGEDDNQTLRAYAGNSYKHVGFLAETYLTRGDGFKELDNGGPTGFEKKDFMAKLRFNTATKARIYQALTLKAGSTTETSDETYLGLTDQDFDRTPFRRYAGSQADVMDTEHRLLQARHFIRPSQTFDLTTTAYRTDFERNWYKLDRVRATSSGSAVSIGSMLADPVKYQAEYAIVTGATSPNENALEVKANNRSYYAQGIESILGVQFDTRGWEHDVEIGVRLHKDEVDRFQWVDLYRMQEGQMQRTAQGTHGTDSNRIESAEALATFVQYRLTAGKLFVSPGLRFEHITMSLEDYGKADPERTGSALSKRKNTVDIWIPGIGLDYQITPQMSTFGGIHKGFSPPGSNDETKPEESWNYELGARYQTTGLRTQAVVFFNDYSNLLGADLAASGGQGTGDQFNGGAVDVKGLELSMAYDLGLLAQTRLALPLQVAYTYTDASFQSSFQSEFEGWGSVKEGDDLPYLPKHQIAIGLGVESQKGSLHLNTRFVDKVRTQAGQGDFDEATTVDGHLVVDLSVEFKAMRHASIIGMVRNVTDEVYAVARRPAGIRPGLPRQFLIGIKTNL